MNGLRHPFTGALYEADGEATVRVTLGNCTGWFTPEGRWLRGELRDADPHLCGWVAGPRVTGRFATPKEPSATSSNGNGQIEREERWS